MLYEQAENASLTQEVIIGEIIIIPEQTLKKIFSNFHMCAIVYTNTALENQGRKIN